MGVAHRGLRLMLSIVPYTTPPALTLFRSSSPFI